MTAGVLARPLRHRAPIVLSLLAVGVVVAVSLPLAYLVVRAVSGGAAAWSVLGRARLAELVLQTMLLVASVTAAAIAVAVPLAWLVTRTDLPGRRVWGVLAALPLVVPSYVAALSLLAAFGPRGAVQRALETIGVERLPDVYGFPGAFAALVLATYPYVFLLTAAALRDVDPALEEAARSLGRPLRSVLRTITFPIVRPAVAAGGLLVALYVLSDFGAVSLMQYDSLTRAIFLQYRALFDRTPAAVLALVLVALTAVVLVLEARSRGRGRAYRAARSGSQPAATIALGVWRYPALGFCALVVGLALVVPIGVLVYWLVRAGAFAPSLEAVWRPAVNSVLVSALAAGAVVAAALPVALLAVRHPRPWTRGLEGASYLSQALPGIVVALALVFFASRVALPLYQTVGLLVAAYVVRFFAQALAATRTALVRVDPSLEDAARSLGRSRPRAIASVTAPLVSPGLMAGATVVFLSTMKELPATLLLRPIGFDTLATEIWTATSLGRYSQATLPALLLVLASLPFVYALASRRARELAAPG
ncbi:MAG: iron ABC transporter permease [Actinobacteria bacterium]|nr:iron ABC transporter permease [Actinomycetota bacterium]